MYTEKRSHKGHSKKARKEQAKERNLEETKLVDTLILGFWPLELDKIHQSVVIFLWQPKQTNTYRKTLALVRIHEKLNNLVGEIGDIFISI
jgi:hypothetical protein